MGTYKVFNGTDWVNICDCQVHIRNASNNWQLLDPTNCVTKYWTGTEWCEVICTPVDPCACTTGEVVIGTQTWTCRNLDVTEYRDGTPIPQVTDQTQWNNLTTGAWCHYNNDPANDAIYGKLYNWYAVTDPRGLAPFDYHVPTDAEWATLVSYLGGVSVAGGKMKEVGTTLWASPNVNATNESCFTGLPGGIRFLSLGFDWLSTRGTWWSTAEYQSIFGIGCTLNNNIGNANTTFQSRKQNGSSVRLVKD
jgi:uncharacterized protein (TIGR02145 family)